MRTLKLIVPDSLDLNETELKMIVASKLYEQGKLSLGQAAEIVGISKRTFTELLARYDVSIFNYPATEIAADVKNA